MFRFAPSTTQDLNIETLQVALFNYIVSSQQNDKLHINMKDTNTEKNIDGKDQEILEILALFGIKWSEVSYQSHNLKFHQQLATKLLMDKNAFSCFCSKSLNDKPYDGTCENLSDEEVLNNEKPFSIRLRQPDKDISFEDKIQGKVTFEKSSIDSFVILNVDKTATQDFASAIDDMLTDISLVIQNKDQLSNTPKQILIRDYLGYDKTIEYAHLPTILDAPSLIWLLEEGFLPSAITNYLILIANQTPKEIFTLDEAKE
ncbi:MAG: glutamate--tRNA ligase, partial [Epsilonproteobacteria bacterium]|nr:glutamate--tRNA ligase [Campylobacterota bacterium]